MRRPTPIFLIERSLCSINDYSFYRNVICSLSAVKNSKNNYLSSFSRQSLAININFVTSLLNADCVSPKSSKAHWLIKFNASLVKDTRFCILSSSAFHFSRNSSFSIVMLTFIAIAILTFFFLVIYIFCHLDIKARFIYVFKQMSNCQEVLKYS